MILILERYIARAIILTTSLTALILAGILFFVALLTEMKNVGEGDYGIVQAILFVVMRMPGELYQFSPILMLLGSIAGLSILSTSREIAVMRAAGFSIQAILKSVLMASVLLLVVLGMIGEWFAPRMSYDAEIHKEYARNSGQAVITTSGIWFHVDNNFIHVATVIDHQLLQGITRYQFDKEHRLQEAYYAKSLAYENHQWVMHDVAKTTFYNNRAKSETLAESPWNVHLNTNLLRVGVVEASELSLPRLQKYISFLEKNGLQASEYKYEFWQRLMQPIAALIMVFLAIPFVLGSLNSASLGWRMMMGVGLGFAFFILKAFLGQLCVVYQIPPIFAAIIPLVFFGGLGFLLFRKIIKQ